MDQVIELPGSNAIVRFKYKNFVGHYSLTQINVAQSSRA